MIIATVLAQIEAVGYDAVELRTIARGARVSLATIYKSFPSRDALLLAAVEQWIDPHCDAWPINRMSDFPIDWYVIDEARGWVLLEYRNIRADPGDGPRLETRSYTRLKYGGNGQWRFEEDIYSPLRMRAMLDAWVLLNSRAGGSRGAG